MFHGAERRGSLGRFFLLIAFLALLAGFPSADSRAAALSPVATTGQSEAPATDWESLTPQERTALIARLSDDQVREILLQQLDVAAAGDEAAQNTFMGNLDDEVNAVRENLGLVLAEIWNLPSVIPFAFERLTKGRSDNHLLLVLLFFGVMIAVGAGAEWFVRWATRAPRERIRQRAQAALGTKFLLLVYRFLLDGLAVAVFLIGALGVFFALYQGHQPTRYLVMTYLTAIMVVRVSALVSRLLLAPKSPVLRIVPFADADAEYFNRCILWFAGVYAFGIMSCSLLRLLGLDPQLHLLLVVTVSTVLIVMLVTMLWRGRKPVAALIREGAGEDTVFGQVRRVFAETWHLLAIAYVVGIYFFSVFGSLSGHPAQSGAGIGSILIVLAFPFADAALKAILDGVFFKSGADRRSRMEMVVHRALRVVLILVALFLLGNLWGIDIFSLARGETSAVVFRAVLDIGFTLLLAYVGWELVMSYFDRHLPAQEDAGAIPEGEGGGAAASRLQTLMPLIRRFVQITIVVLVVMIILSSLGVNIGPLLAGAGVVGLAVGFGAQTLVRDIVSGVFFLADDAFRLGEYVDIGDVKGTVEGINVRSLVLRHHRGALHTVPYGEIQYLTNYSRDWAIMKLQFRLTYDTDVMKVKKIFKKIGAELLEHPELGEFFIEPLKSQGVLAMEDSAMILRAKFTAKPGKQFQIRKEVFSRVQQEFAEAGIHFAHRRVTVDLPEGVDPKSEQGKAIADAAAAAVGAEEQKEPGQAPAVGGAQA